MPIPNTGGPNRPQSPRRNTPSELRLQQRLRLHTKQGRSEQEGRRYATARPSSLCAQHGRTLTGGSPVASWSQRAKLSATACLRLVVLVFAVHAAVADRKSVV